MSNLKERCENTVEQMEELLEMAIKNYASKDSYKECDLKDFAHMKTILAFFDEICDLLKYYGEEFDKRGEALERIEKKLENLDKIEN